MGDEPSPARRIHDCPTLAHLLLVQIDGPIETYCVFTTLMRDEVVQWRNVIETVVSRTGAFRPLIHSALCKLQAKRLAWGFAISGSRLFSKKI